MPKLNLILFLALGAVVVSAVIVTLDHSAPMPGEDPRLTRVEPLAEGADVIVRNYFRPVRDKKLLQDAMRGMVEGLDEFSTYIPPEMQEGFNSHLRGRDRGLGLKLEAFEDSVVVLGPMMNSPAHRAGVRTGDRILSVDGKSVAGLTLDQVEELLDGPHKQAVTLVVARQGSRKTLQLESGELPLETVVGLYRDPMGQWVYLLDEANGIGYVRIKEFVPHTSDDLENAIRRMGLPRMLVLDLRDNPGGSLESAVACANLFLKSGVIVSEIDRTGKARVFSARPEKAYFDALPLVVLINGRTASAAEIVAGALWVHDRAILVGTRTRGKGCVQTMFPVGKLGQVNLTTAEYCLEGNLPISRRPGSDWWGVDPHVQTLSLHDDELAAVRLRGEVLYNPLPATLPASWPSEDRVGPLLLTLDTQLVQARKCLLTPDVADSLLKQAARERQLRQKLTTAPAEVNDE